MLKSLCSGWEFTENWTEDFPAFTGAAREVRLPHSVRALPQNYASPADYEMVCGYRRKLDIPASAAGKRLFLQFDGAAHIASVYVNSRLAATHRCGYTAFRVEITDLVRPGEDNSVAVKLDCSENGEIPPFGFVIDYLTYGGLYREAWLDVREESYVRDVFVIAGMDRRTMRRQACASRTGTRCSPRPRAAARSRSARPPRGSGIRAARSSTPARSRWTAETAKPSPSASARWNSAPTS